MMVFQFYRVGIICQNGAVHLYERFTWNVRFCEKELPFKKKRPSVIFPLALRTHFWDTKSVATVLGCQNNAKTTKQNRAGRRPGGGALRLWDWNAEVPGSEVNKVHRYNTGGHSGRRPVDKLSLSSSVGRTSVFCSRLQVTSRTPKLSTGWVIRN